MSISTTTDWQVALPPPLLMRRFTVDEYHRMIDDGFFAEDERFELLEGWIVAKMPRNPPHDSMIVVIGRILDRALPEGWHLRGQSAIVTADSTPEPDLAIVRGDGRDYLSRHPEPADLALVVEVSDSTLASDRGLKARIYARAGIPVYWIVNLVDHRVEVYTTPTGPVADPGYRECREVEPGATFPLIIDGREIARIDAREVLP
jgi:Uma2 family endonuclease